jgi:hypothetical protein
MKRVPVKSLKWLHETALKKELLELIQQKHIKGVERVGDSFLNIFPTDTDKLTRMVDYIEDTYPNHKVKKYKYHIRIKFYSRKTIWEINEANIQNLQRRPWLVMV